MKIQKETLHEIIKIIGTGENPYKCIFENWDGINKRIVNCGKPAHAFYMGKKKSPLCEYHFKQRSSKNDKTKEFIVKTDEKTNYIKR